MTLSDNSFWVFVILMTSVISVESGSRYKTEFYTCRFLNTNYITAVSWLELPIVFEPINRGRLTIWSGTSSLPGSGFKCYASENGTGSILLDFGNFADKLEWTYHDASRGTTLNGISVNYRKNTVFEVLIDDMQSRSHLNCNTIRAIEPHDEESWSSDLKSACKDCRNSIITFVNSQINEVFKLKLNERIVDGLHWHLSSLIANQHSSGPISL